MHAFHYEQGTLCCEAVPLAVIAQAVGTPFYLYSYTAIRQQYLTLDQALQPIPHLICFAMKACSNQAILKVFIREGAGLDILTGGELYRALAAGADPHKLVYAGVGKSRAEITEALRSDVLLLNVESRQELEAIDAIAASLGKRARVALRVNPAVDPNTHPYIATGLKQSKFGIEIAQVRELAPMQANLPRIEIIGLHCHIGSQITQLSPLVEAAAKVAGLAQELQDAGLDIRYLDLGGGLGIPYQEEQLPALSDYAEAMRQVVAPLGYTLILEPGRALVGNAGALVTRVLYTKQNATRQFVVVDAAMNDLIRPSLYGSYHAILPVEEAQAGAEPMVVDVVGPVCESGDFLARDRPLPPAYPGDLLAVMSAGAYGFSMASNYNSRPLAPEVLVRGDEYFIIRERQTYADLIRGEKVPAFLEGA